jgi:hypothetical protein
MGQQHSAAATDGAQAAQQQQQAQNFPQLQQQPHQEQLNRPGSQTAVWQNQPGVPDVMLQGGLSTSAKSSVGPAARAYKYRIASVGVASAAAVNLTAAAVNLTAAAAAANSTNSSSSSSSSSSNSSSMESEVWIHTPHGQRRQQQLAKPSRHLLAKAAAAAEAAAVVEYDADESWLDGLFGSETEDAYDAKAAAYVEKQFCGKGKAEIPVLLRCSVGCCLPADTHGSDTSACMRFVQSSYMDWGCVQQNDGNCCRTAMIVQEGPHDTTRYRAAR